MNSLPDPRNHEEEAVAFDVESQVEEYLDFLCVPLVGIVPYKQRRHMRLEAADHLRSHIDDLQAEGLRPQAAADCAMHEYGEPWKVGHRLADAYLTGSAHQTALGSIDAIAFKAFGRFGVCTVVTVLVLEAMTLVPLTTGWLTPLYGALLLLGPIAAGILTGMGMEPKTWKGVCQAIALLSLATLPAGLLLRPNTEALHLAAYQLLYWLPVGCLASSATASLRRHSRRQNFQRTTR